MAPLQDTLEAMCAKLREEMLVVQTNALREHAALSRKLEAVIKEKRELSKQLAISHKENRGAKQQIEELLAEKTQLLKRLENATKEFKVNTKVKKMTLGRLEEAESVIDDLKQQLQQAIRDKEILEGKLAVMQQEYERLRQGKDGSFVSNNLEEEEEYFYKHKEHAIDQSEVMHQCIDVGFFRAISTVYNSSIIH